MRSFIPGVAGAVFALAATTTAAATLEGADATLAVDVHAQGGQAWQRLDEPRITALVAFLEQAFERAGFGVVAPRWCGAGECPAHGAAHLALDVNLAEARSGTLSRGFSLELGGSNPRDAGTIRGTLLNVSCRLRTPGGRLVAARDSDEPVRDSLAAGGAVDGDYLARKIADACVPLVAEQRVVRVAPVSAPSIIPTADPDVFIEKREIAVSAPLSPPDAGSPVPVAAAARDTDAPRDAVATEDPEPAAVRLSRAPGATRTQYVLHNKGDTVILEFGGRRR